MAKILEKAEINQIFVVSAREYPGDEKRNSHYHKKTANKSQFGSENNIKETGVETFDYFDDDEADGK